MYFRRLFPNLLRLMEDIVADSEGRYDVDHMIDIFRRDSLLTPEWMFLQWRNQLFAQLSSR